MENEMDNYGELFAYTEIKNRINTASKLKAAVEAIITKLDK
ncbi:hypothetical protein F26_0134 [Escherichia phage vB_Eco_F26]|nr:hypothetical protein F26_0134 [Escherichia phage vB_Eco_F26]